MQRLYFTHAAILTQVSGFGECIVPLLGLQTCVRHLVFSVAFTDCDWKIRSFAHNTSDVRFYFVAWE